MRKNILTALLIVGWISLSGFDLVEDLDEIPGQVTISTASPQDNTASKFAGWGTSANNIVESANLDQQTETTSINEADRVYHFDAVIGFEKHFQRHKLYHVYLI
jgi:hypothetical protein